MNDWLDTAQFHPLQNRCIHVWLFQLDLSPVSISRFLPLLDAEEKSRCNRFVHSVHRDRFIAAHGFMRSVLELYLQQPAAALCFAKGEHGKPFFSGRNDLHFNLSHSQDIAILAVAGHDIGVDVEYVNRKNDWKKIMQRFYTAPEQKQILSLPEPLQQRAFFQVWTRKEAHMKVTGQGLYLSPSQFTVSAPPDQAALLDMDSGQDIRQWQMFDIDLPDTARDYCACLSLAGTAESLLKFVFL
ncbi:MAG: 4-phosphopantetheinyl transferase [Pseudomonadota bacterium]|nr:4-phosphopantetheinyl transferase [Pseudomonadota bacterium]